MALILTAGGGGTQIAAGVMFGVSALAMAGGSLARVGGDRNRKVDRERRSYQRYLAQIRRQARAATADQAESLFWVHPDPPRPALPGPDVPALGTAARRPGFRGAPAGCR